jgi:hypothetical protein
MSEQDNAGRAAMRYIATARAYCFDLTAMAFLFVSVSIMAGRVWCCGRNHARYFGGGDCQSDFRNVPLQAQFRCSLPSRN